MTIMCPKWSKHGDSVGRYRVPRAFGVAKGYAHGTFYVETGSRYVAAFRWECERVKASGLPCDTDGTRSNELMPLQGYLVAPGGARHWNAPQRGRGKRTTCPPTLKDAREKLAAIRGGRTQGLAFSDSCVGEAPGLTYRTSV